MISQCNFSVEKYVNKPTYKEKIEQLFATHVKF